MATATRTRRKPAPTRAPVRPLFPDLPIGIYSADGKLLRVATQADPRNGLVRAFNSFGLELYAAPLKAVEIVKGGNHV